MEDDNGDGDAKAGYGDLEIDLEDDIGDGEWLRLNCIYTRYVLFIWIYVYFWLCIK